MLAALFTLYLLFSLRVDVSVWGAFTEVTRGSSSTVEQNAQGTWCFYPQPQIRIDVACTGVGEQFIPVIDAHLAQGVSISYYAASLQRLGGSEYPVRTSTGVTFLCTSGRILDGRYITQCGIVRQDNVVGSPRCTLERSQGAVSDGCYEPGIATSRPSAAASASIPAGATRPVAETTSGSALSPTGIEEPSNGDPYSAAISFG